jgi:hypothetical protein
MQVTINVADLLTRFTADSPVSKNRGRRVDGSAQLASTGNSNDSARLAHIDRVTFS